MDKEHLFSIEGNIEDVVRNLDDGIIPSFLRNGLEERGYPLSDDEHISVTVVRRSKEWELYDEIEESTYRIIKEYEKVKIYEIQKEASSMDKQYLFSIMPSISQYIIRNLNEGNIPKLLRDEYKSAGYYLSDDENVSLKIFTDQWKLYDEIEGYIYEIKKENERLYVYNIQKEEESDVDKQKEESGRDKQKEQESTRKSTSPFEINRIKAIGIGKNILRSLGLFIIPSILIWLGLDILGMASFIILIALILTMGIIAIIVGVYSGLSSKTKSSGFISGFISVFVGSLIVILLISSIMGAGADQETEGPTGLEGGEGTGGEFLGYLFVMGIIGGISAALGNSIVSNEEVG